ncbi:MAG: HAMP domain-containing sensor histidine kinase [Gemmatimonadaceae bacterium]
MTSRASVRPSFVWLQVLLVAALACVALILADAFRAANSSHRVAERAIRDYASFAAWSYREHLTTAIRLGVDELLSPVNHGDALHNLRGIPDVDDMAKYMPWNAACDCHRPKRGPMPLRYVGFKLGSDTTKIGPNHTSKSSERPTPEMVMAIAAQETRPKEIIRISSAESHWINGLLTAVAHRKPRSTWGYDLTIAHRDSSTQIFASRLMAMDTGDTILYAVEYSKQALDSVLGAVLNAPDLLPPSLVATHGNSEILDVEVADASGALMYRTPRPVVWDLDANMTLPDSYGGLKIRMQIRPPMISTLLIGGLPASRVPLLLMMLALTITLCVFAGIQLRREAKFSNERTNFVASVSHELRTPLTQVRLVLDTLRLGRGNDETVREHALKVADREVLRLQHLVEAVLRFARGPRRNSAPRVATDAYAEAVMVAQEFQPLATPRNIVVEVTGDEGATVSLQNGALRQTLLNLLDNAVKYGRDNAPIVVDVRKRPGSGVTLSVRDSGPGVSATDRLRVWRPFERGEAAKARAAGGSGIGLTIVAEIAAEHGGKAWVEDAPGGGALFIVEIPERTT